MEALDRRHCLDRRFDSRPAATALHPVLGVDGNAPPLVGARGVHQQELIDALRICGLHELVTPVWGTVPGLAESAAPA